MYGIHFDHHTLSIARDGELLASEPLAVETGGGEPRAGRRGAGRVRAAGRTKCRSATGASSAATKSAARNVAREMLAQLRALGIAERIDAVIAVPADLDAAALTEPARRAARGRRRRARLRRRRRRSAPRRSAERGHYVLLEAGWRSATATRVAGGAECAVRRILRERTRQPARRLRPVADRGGGAPWSRTRASIRC